jgi:hypothetical protein
MMPAQTKTALLTILFLGIASLSIIIYKGENQKRVMKEDLIELSKIKYGLFSVDEWKTIVSNLIVKKVEAFNLDETNREEMRSKIQALLYRAIDDFETNFKESSTSSARSFVESLVASTFGIFGKIRDRVPVITEQVIDFMEVPENRDKVKAFLIKKVNAYADSTFSEIDYSMHDQAIARHGFSNREEAIAGLTTKISDLDDKTALPKLLLYLSVGAAAIGLFFIKNPSKIEITLLITISLCLLLFGVSLPMIEIDARISSMTFVLLGEPVSFQDQVLYYKSKSILEVVQLMLTQGRFDVLFVGLLVLLFSVLFPVGKLIAVIVYTYLPGTNSNRFLSFMVFKTGKWSMADVMVVAIFMAYIGFSGIVGEQLRQLEGIGTNIEVLTTNKSNLQIGFFLFASFTILSLLVTAKIPAPQLALEGQRKP